MTAAGVAERGLDRGEPLLHRVGGALPAALRAALLERLEVLAHGAAVGATLGERGLVLRRSSWSSFAAMCVVLLRGNTGCRVATIPDDGASPRYCRDGDGRRSRAIGPIRPEKATPMPVGSTSMDHEPLHRQLGLTDDELRATVDELGREPTELELAMYSVMWSEHCSYKSSRRVPRPLPHRGAVGARRPGRGRRRHRRRRRPRGRGAHREPQPPVGGRAVPGRGDRRRRHHPRHLLDGRATDRAHGPAALRSARRRAHALPVRGRRLRHQRLRQRGRRADRRAARSCSTSATATTRS